MKIRFETRVKGHYKEVMKRFDRELFEALKPKQGEMEIVEFTGSKTGDRVHLKFTSPFSMEWVSDIISHGEDDEKAFFVDEGVKLPFPIGFWRHQHIVEKVDEQYATIIDDIEYKASPSFLTPLIYPALYAAFYPRKKVYQSYFGV
ncbi:MAG: cyclase [Saprospiraceae bacterium]|nr:cyclase [Saprospiraceae bacterium]